MFWTAVHCIAHYVNYFSDIALADGLAPTPARDGASSSSDDDDDGKHEADARVAIAQTIKASPELYEPILLRKKVDVNEIARVCGADAKTVKAYLDDEGVPNVRRRAAPKRTRVRSPQPGA